MSTRTTTETKPLSIGQVADRAGIGVETVRFYERQGLIEEPPRRDSGYRQFPESVLYRLHFIRKARELGFSLPEIKELLSLGVDSSSVCAQVQERVDQKLAHVGEKIAELERIQAALTEVLEECKKGPSSDGCQFLDVLHDQP